MTDCLDALLAQKELLQAELPRLLAKATPEQAAELRAAYQQARQNWNNAVNKALAPGNQDAAALISQLEVTQRDIEEACHQLDDVSGTISKITTGVQIASKIVKFLV